MPNNYQRGSIWRKWDLHVHSPFSHGFSGTWEQFETQLQNAECDVIGINDYFSIGGYKKIKEKIDGGTLDLNGKKILPVVEFRMRDVLQNRHTGNSGNNINFHIIFDDTIAVSKIETFLKSLEVDGSQIADKYDNPKFLKETARVYFEKDVLNALKDNPDFQDKFIVLLPYDEYGGIGDIDPNSDDWIKKGFIKKAGILGSSNRNQIDFFLWKSPLTSTGSEKFTQAQFSKWFGVKKPCIKGSDSHDYQHPLGKLKDANSNPIEKFCWIKAEPTFEGLKQVVFDPESRVSIQEKQPVQPNNVIDSITFKIPKDAKINVKQKDGTEKEEPFCFANMKGTFYLSPFLNCFIGGRGSGKSTVLNFLGQHSNNYSSSNAFWEKIQPSFDITDRDLFTFDGVETFEFIGQSEVESFATNKEAFTDAIYERANIKSDGLLEKDEAKLSQLLEKISSFRMVVENIEKALEDQKTKEKEKKTLESSIKITESQEYAAIISKITQKSNQKQQLESWRTAVEELRESIGKLNEQQFVSSEETEEDSSEEEFPVEANEDDIVKPYQEAFNMAQSNIEKALEILDEKNFKALIKKEEKLSEEIETEEKELSKLLKNGGLSEENILQVKSAPQKLVKASDELTKIKKRFEDKKKELNGYDAVLQEAQTVKNDYEKVIDDSIKPLVTTLKEQAKENDKEDIKDIGLTYFFDLQQAWKEIAIDFYDYFAKHHDRERADLLKGYIVDNKEVFSGTQEDIQAFIAKDEKNVGYMKFLKEVFVSESNYQIFQTIRDRHLNDVAKHKSIQVLYDGKDIERASFGQKCTAVMVVLLLFGNYPLIIDEPEAHLDGSLIANYLVPLIKKKKNNRQIIFATHNANFVVNGDSEKIFILQNETGTTQFIETTIEDLENRDELLKLEGGRDAFRKRGEKLHI